jgi:hypothetical protein
LLGIQPPSLHIAICGPVENADYLPGQLPFGSMRLPGNTDNQPSGNRPSEVSPA